YESSSDPLDPNYTRSYSYTIEPKTFVGIMGTYKVSDMLSISGGIANDEYGYYDSQYNYAVYNEFVPGNSFESEKCYFGSVSLTAPDSMGFLKGATLSGGVIHNLNTFSDGADYPQGPTTSLYAGVTLPTPVTQLKVGGSFDYLFEDNIGAGVPSTGADLWDIAGYATFQASDKLSLNLRAEFYDNRTAGDDAPIGLYDNNNAEEVTATVQYNLFANVITRGEFRWDHVEHGEAFGYNNIGDTDRSNDFLLALNVIYQF
ncbi:MAG: outer membrane beta-barrel protein, partial [Limisphaerales bacterium]